VSKKITTVLYISKFGVASYLLRETSSTVTEDALTHAGEYPSRRMKVHLLWKKIGPLGEEAAPPAEDEDAYANIEIYDTTYI
jgi:hypothetical protein